jgi:hypothetical protein
MVAMKLRPLFSVLLGLLAAGCSYSPYAYQNLIEAPLDVLERYALRQRFRRMAADVWVKVCADKDYSRAYERGFKDGFVEFLDADGTGNPPAAPPWWFRQSWFLTPARQQDIEDWLEGFRHGTLAAQETGYREVVTVPLGLPPLRAAGTQPPQGPGTSMPGELVDLPMPRVVPPDGQAGKEPPEILPMPTPQRPGGK